MSFFAHTSHVERLCKQLETLPHKNPTEQKLHEILEYICNNHTYFENSISTTSPFYEEFFRHICEEKLDEESYFALLECLIVFCRERQLQNAHTEHEHEIERQLLNFFEHSAHWHVEDTTLIHQWYWHTLPAMYNRAS